MDRVISTKWVIDRIDSIVKPLVVFSVAMLAVECHMYPETDSHGSHPFFLWSERCVALILTVEYVFRWWRGSGKGFYPRTVFGLIDLASVVPFWVGFILRLIKQRAGFYDFFWVWDIHLLFITF